MTEYNAKLDDSGKPLIPTITLPGRTPQDDSEMPSEINGVKVVPFEMEEPTIRKFTRSEIRRLTEMGQYSKYRDEIIKANQLNLVRDDITDPDIRKRMDASAASSASADELLFAVKVKNAKAEQDGLLKKLQDAQSIYSLLKDSADDYERVAAESRVNDLNKQFDESSARMREVNAEALERSIRRKQSSQPKLGVTIG